MKRNRGAWAISHLWARVEAYTDMGTLSPNFAKALDDLLSRTYEDGYNDAFQDIADATEKEMGR